MGLDSLMAVELRNQIGRALETRLPSTLVFDYPTIDALQAYLLAELFTADDVAQPATVLPSLAAPATVTAVTSDDDQSADEIAELLAQLVYSEKL